MKTLGERSVASFIRFVLDAAWWLVVVPLALLIGLLVFGFFVNLEGNNLTMNLPVALELNAPVHGSGGSMETDARIEKLRGNLRFPIRNGAFFSGSMFLIVLLLGSLLWVLTQLRHIFRSLSRGLLFIPENARRIRWVGFTVIFGELARAALVYFGVTTRACTSPRTACALLLRRTSTASRLPAASPSWSSPKFFGKERGCTKTSR